MQHIDIHPYTPQQICLDVNSINSGTDIANNLFLYFDKKQKMNNGNNKNTLKQNNQTLQQKFSIYAPILDGLYSCKREVISSLDCQQRTNFIQKNKKFILKSRHNTADPTNRQLNQHYQSNANKQQKCRKNSKCNFQEFPNIEDGFKTKIYSANKRKSFQSGDIDNFFPQHHFISEGYVSNQKDLPKIKNKIQNIQDIGLETQQQQIYTQKKIKLQTGNHLGLNSSFDISSNHKNTLNKKYLYSNNNLNISTLTQGVLETQADTTLQIPCESTVEQNNIQIKSNPTNQIKPQHNNKIIQKQLSQEQKIQTLNKTYLSNFATEENEVEYFKENTFQNNNNNKIVTQNHHFNSQKKDGQHNISNQQIELMQIYKNIDGTRTDTFQNLNYLNDISEKMDKGVERVSAILNLQNLNEHSIDKKVLNSSYKSLLNERPPFQKQSQNKIKIRSQSCLTDSNQLSQDISKKCLKNTHNNSFQDINQQEFNVQASNKNIQKNYQMNANSNTASLNIQFDSQKQISHESQPILEQLPQEKSDLLTLNNNENEKIYDFLNYQTLSLDKINDENTQSNKKNMQQEEALKFIEKNEDKEQNQESIKEDIQNTYRIDQQEEKQNNNKLNQQINEDISKDYYELNQINKSQEKLTPQKCKTNMSSNQNSLLKQQNIKSNHITFNAASYGKEYFQSNEQSNNQQNISFLQSQPSSDSKYQTSSFDGRINNQNLIEQQKDQEMRVSKYISEMQEYIQNQIDNSKIVINQFHQTNSQFQVKNNPKQEPINQSLPTNNNNNSHPTISVEQKNQLDVNKSNIPSKPQTEIKKMNIQKKFNFYDELDKKLEEKKKNITNYIETSVTQVEPTQQTNNSFMNKEFIIRPKSQQASNRSYVNGRYNQVQLNGEHPIQNQPFSQRKKNQQDHQFNELKNLQLNESKFNNFGGPSMKENKQQLNNFDISNINNINKITDAHLNMSNEMQQTSLEKIQQLRPLTQQIYYDQFLESHLTQGTNNNNKNEQLQFNNTQTKKFDTNENSSKPYKCSKRPQSQQNSYQFSDNQQSNLIQLQYYRQQDNKQLPGQQNKVDSRDCINDISQNKRIVNKQRSSTMDNFFQNQKNKDNSFPQINPYDRQSLQNSSRNEYITTSSHNQLSKEQQLEIFKQVKEQSQNKHKLHSYLKQNQSLHDIMKQKQLSSTICKDNSIISQHVQNQINETLNNVSSNNLGYMCNSEQTSQLNLNNHLQSTQKNSYNQFNSLSNTYDLLQYLNQIENSQANQNNNTLNQSVIQNKQQDYARFQQNQNSSKQYPLTQSIQSQINCKIKSFNNTDIQYSSNNFSNERDIKINGNQNSNIPLIDSKSNLLSIPQPTEEDTAFIKNRPSLNVLQNIQTLQQNTQYFSIDQQQNNLQFYDNLNSLNYDDTKENLAIDQKVYANHQYAFAKKRQQRREDNQVLKQIDNIFNNTCNLNNNQQLMQNNQKQQQNQIKSQNQKEQLSQLYNDQNNYSQKENIIKRNIRNQFDSKNSYENQPVLQNNFNLSLSLNQQNDENNSQTRTRQTNSKKSHRYNIKLYDDLDDKTLEYSGSKAGVENYQ